MIAGRLIRGARSAALLLALVALAECDARDGDRPAPIPAGGDARYDRPVVVHFVSAGARELLWKPPSGVAIDRRTDHRAECGSRFSRHDLPAAARWGWHRL